MLGLSEEVGYREVAEIGLYFVPFLAIFEGYFWIDVEDGLRRFETTI